MTMVRFGISYDKYPGLRQYYLMLSERPSVVDSTPPHWKEDPAGTKEWLANV